MHENPLLKPPLPLLALSSNPGPLTSPNLSVTSGLTKDTLDAEAPEEQTVIPSPNANGRPLKYVNQYIEHPYEPKAEPIEKPLKGKVVDVPDEWGQQVNGREPRHQHVIKVCASALGWARSGVRRKGHVDNCPLNQPFPLPHHTPHRSCCSATK